MSVPIVSMHIRKLDGKTINSNKVKQMRNWIVKKLQRKALLKLKITTPLTASHNIIKTYDYLCNYRTSNLL